MADGSRTAEIEADAAAAEAAREAKAEVLERAAKVESAETLPPAARSSKTKGNEKAKKSQWAEFVVDVWITPFNSVEFGIYKHSRNRAKSRQFTSDMDIFAEVIEKGERTGLLGYREDLWRKNTGMDKRLVFKLFNETRQLARHHGPDDRPQPAADTGGARAASDVLLHQCRRSRQHGLS